MGGPPYTVERWLNDLEQLRRHWKHPQWIAFGHSFGAELALAYAAAFPTRVSGIIYMSCLPAALGDSRGEEEFLANRLVRIAEPLRARFVEIECPALVLHSDRDLRPIWAAERLAHQLPNARLVRLPGGHFPWVEAPFELRRLLQSFVSAIVGAT